MSSLQNCNDGSLRSCVKAIWDILAMIAVLAFLTGGLYLWHFHATYEPDSVTYIVPASNLALGHGFTDARGYPETNRTPGYSLAILPFIWAHLDLTYLILLQHLLRVLVIVLTTGFTFFLTRKRLPALLVGGILCIDVPLLDSANSVLTEMLFTALLVIALGLLWIESHNRGRTGLLCVLAGFLAGASVLVRPISLYLFIPLAAYFLLVHRQFRVRAALIFVLSFLSLPLAWSVRNGRETGSFTVSSISGFSLLQYRAAGVLALKDHGDFELDRAKHAKELELQACEEFQRERGRDCSQASVPEKSQYFSRLARRFLLHHKLGLIELGVRGVGMMMLSADLSAITGIRHLGLAFTVPALLFALWGWVQCWKKFRAFFWMATLVMGYFIAVSAGAEAYSRFRVPIVPLYAILTAIGLDVALARVWHASRTSRKQLS